MTKNHLTSKIVDILFKVVTGLCAGSPVLFLGAIALMIVVESLPSIQFMGWHFITGIKWNMGNVYGNIDTVHGVDVPHGATYGALPFIVGTLSSSLIGLIIAVPISIYTAVILAYRVRKAPKMILSMMVELLAGMPSVVIGLWGITVLAPWISRDFGPLLAGLGKFIPIFRGSPGTGQGLLASGIVLALMVIPIITATTRDLLEQVPLLQREGGIGLGMTHWEVVRKICLPYIKDGLIGGIALGWGRAMGETMAVLMVSGNALNYLPKSIFSPVSTMAAVIASELDSAFTDATHMAIHALSELALILLIMTLITNIIARVLVNHSRNSKAKVG